MHTSGDFPDDSHCGTVDWQLRKSRHYLPNVWHFRLNLKNFVTTSAKILWTWKKFQGWPESCCRYFRILMKLLNLTRNGDHLVNPARFRSPKVQTSENPWTFYLPDFKSSGSQVPSGVVGFRLLRIRRTQISGTWMPPPPLAPKNSTNGFCRPCTGYAMLVNLCRI